MRILVTGGAGFIGSHLCERLVQRGHEVAILDDLNDSYDPLLKEENLSAIAASGWVDFTAGDIRDQLAVRALFQRFRPETVVHLAARVGVRPSLESPLLYEQVNVAGTIVLLEAARRNETERFIFASSSSIYGIANRLPFSEDDTISLPVSPYAATKIAGEKICHTYAYLYGLKIACLRFFTVFGPRQRPDLAIRTFLERIDRDDPILVFGDGTMARDYTYVDDVVSGILAALEFDGLYQTFNLGNARPVDLQTVIATLEEALGKKARIRYVPKPTCDVSMTFADIRKARRMLGYVPSVSFEEGISRTVAWFRRHYESVGHRSPRDPKLDSH